MQHFPHTLKYTHMQASTVAGSLFNPSRTTQQRHMTDTWSS